MKKQLLFAALAACITLSIAACDTSENLSSDSSSSSESAPVTETHTYVEHDAADATCDVAGNEKYYTCEDCDKIFDADKNEVEEIPVVAALGHAYALQAAADGTCNSKGTFAHYVCEDCGKLFDLAKQEITSAESVVNPFNHVGETALTISAQPTKTTYSIGEAFDATGMVLVYKCDNCDGEIVDTQHLTYTYQTVGATAFAAGDTKVTVGFKDQSFDVAVTVEKARAEVLGVAASYNTVCGVAPDVKATSSIPSSEIHVAYYDGASEITAEELLGGKTYTVKVWTETTDMIEGTEVSATVNVAHGYAWKNDAENWQKVYYQCNCGAKEDFYALDYQSRYVDEDDLAVDLSDLVCGAEGKTVTIQSVQQIVRLTNDGIVEAKDGEKKAIDYTNNGMVYTFSVNSYEKLTDPYKPFILTLSVVYEVDGLECPLVVEVKFVDKLIKNADDLKELAYTGTAQTSLGGTLNDKYYALAGDIDASGVEFTSSKPAFEEALGFRGVFEGNGHTISNLTIAGGQGLFGAVGAGAKIQNVSFTNVKVAAGNYALAYVLRSTALTNVKVEFAQDSQSFLVTYSANNCAFDNTSILTQENTKPFLINEKEENAYPESIVLSYFPAPQKVEVILEFGARTDSGVTNEYGKVYNISREQWYIDNAIMNTMGTLQTSKLANALPEGFTSFEFWVYNPLTTENRFHLAGDVNGTWTDSDTIVTLAPQAWTKVTISQADIELNQQGQWYVYVLDGGMEQNGWKISTIYAVK